jgi:hypothetical protein
MVLKTLKLIYFFLFGLGINLAFTTQGYAYVDPGTGGLILQGSLACFVTIALAARVFWDKIKTFFGVLFRKNTEKSDQ